jgi:hypothetical protein
MQILFDQRTPAMWRRTLLSRGMSTTLEMEWQQLENGKWAAEAEKTFDAHITTDKNIRCQQNLAR